MLTGTDPGPARPAEGGSEPKPARPLDPAAATGGTSGRRSVPLLQDELVYQVRGREIRVPLFTESLSRQKIPKIALPRSRSRVKSTAGCGGKTCPATSPTPPACSPEARGRGPHPHVRRRRRPGPHQRRFKLLSANSDAKRLSTAFDSVTLYGYDPDRGRTSTARSATPGSASAPWTT
jgi:methylmalonyl-CoA mutase